MSRRHAGAGVVYRGAPARSASAIEGKIEELNTSIYVGRGVARKQLSLGLEIRTTKSLLRHVSEQMKQ